MAKEVQAQAGRCSTHGTVEATREATNGRRPGAGGMRAVRAVPGLVSCRCLADQWWPGVCYFRERVRGRRRAGRWARPLLAR